MLCKKFNKLDFCYFMQVLWYVNFTTINTELKLLAENVAIHLINLENIADRISPSALCLAWLQPEAQLGGRQVHTQGLSSRTMSSMVYALSLESVHGGL